MHASMDMYLVSASQFVKKPALRKKADASSLASEEQAIVLDISRIASSQGAGYRFR